MQTTNTGINNTDSSSGTAQQADQLLATIRSELDRSCATLDGSTLSRLHSIRSEAVARKPSRLQSWLLPFGTLATAAALVLSVGIAMRGGAASEVQAAELEDIEILVADEALDFYADYEFYQWLAQD